MPKPLIKRKETFTTAILSARLPEPLIRKFKAFGEWNGHSVPEMLTQVIEYTMNSDEEFTKQYHPADIGSVDKRKTKKKVTLSADAA